MAQLKYCLLANAFILSLEIKNVKRSPVVGQNFTYWCKYNQAGFSTTKFICKGEDPSICQALVNTRQPAMNNRFFMTDNTTEKNITITVREVTAADSGTYWCGAETKQQQSSNKFFNRLFLTGETCRFILWLSSDPWSLSTGQTCDFLIFFIIHYS